MAIRVIKIQGIDTIYDATTTPSVDVNIADIMVRVDGFHDVTRYWGFGEGNTVGDADPGDSRNRDYDFTNLPADSTATNAIDSNGHIVFRDQYGRDRKWRPCGYVVKKYDIISDGNADL